MLKIEQIRKNKKMSRYFLSKRTGIWYNTLAKIEKGGDTRLSTLYVIAEALEVDVKDLFG